MPLGTAYPFGLRDVKLTPFTDPTTETLGTPVDLPASRTLTFTDSEDYEDLRGDDKTILSLGKGSTLSWELEAGGISIDAYKIFAGVTTTSSGTTPEQVTTMTKNVATARPYFQIEGQSISDGGGDLHVVILRCKATGDIEGEFSDGNFYLTKCSGQGYPSIKSATEDDLYKIIQNEASTPITGS